MDSSLSFFRMHWDHEPVRPRARRRPRPRSQAIQSRRRTRTTRRSMERALVWFVRIFCYPFAHSGGFFSRNNVSPAFGTSRTPSSSRFEIFDANAVRIAIAQVGLLAFLGRDLRG